ncbi:Vitamin B12 import ATP-binding protein BtuD [Streptomyces alboniger]
MISASGIELRAGARVLIESATFRVAKGDRIGLVGRNGAGKTTLTKCLAGEGTPAAGTITRSGEVGYLPQDPRTGDLDVLARDRVLSARGLDVLIRKMRENEQRIAVGQGATREKALRQYERQETEFLTKGGYAAEAEAATIAAALNLPDRVLGQPLHTLSGGQRRRIELARILFSDADTLLLDEPTNHLDADSSRLAARLPQDVPRRFHRDLRRRGPGRDGRQQGLLPGRQPSRLTAQEGCEALPGAARGRRGARRERHTPRRGFRPARAGATRCAPATTPSARRLARRRPAAGRSRGRASSTWAPGWVSRSRAGAADPLVARGCRRTARWRSAPTRPAIDKGAGVANLAVNGAGSTTLRRPARRRRDARHRDQGAASRASPAAPTRSSAPPARRAGTTPGDLAGIGRLEPHAAEPTGARPTYGRAQRGSDTSTVAAVVLSAAAVDGAPGRAGHVRRPVTGPSGAGSTRA